LNIYPKGGIIMKKVVVSLFLVLALVTGISKEKVTVWFAGTTKSFMDVVESQIVPEFEEKNPDIDMVVDFVPWGELSTKLMTAFAGGIGPDIFMHGQAAVAGFAEKELILPLDEYLSQIENSDDFGTALNVGTYKGKTYFIPVFGSGRLLAYRKDFFKRAGLDPNEPPVTWEQLKAFAVATTEWQGSRLKIAGLDLPVSGIDLQQVWTMFLIANGGRLFDEEFNPIFNGPEGTEALQFYVDLIRKHKVTSEYGLSAVGNLEPIAAGTAAMAFVTSESMSAFKKYAPDAFDNIQLCLPPARYTKAAFYSFAGFMVSRTTKNLDSTIKVLSHLTSKDSIIKINSSLGGIPPRQSAAEASFVSSDPVTKMFVLGTKYAFGNPNVPFWVQARDILSKYLEQAIRGVVNPKEALDKAAEEIKKLK
jgi:multiple sugar transport system substrate-binding protein